MIEHKYRTFGNTKAAINLSKILFEKFPKSFRRTSNLLNTYFAFSKEIELIKNTKVKNFCLLQLRNHTIKYLRESGMDYLILSHAENVIRTKYKMSLEK